MSFTIGSLFSGIGGLERGLELAGLGPVLWQVEKDAYCRAVLAKHWPNTQRLTDVRTVDFRILPRVGILCGGWPCQPDSLAGRRRGKEDERWLWPEFARAAEEIEPAIIVGENVPGVLTGGMRTVLADLARLGFDAEWETFSAAHLGAPHLRRRVFLVATHPDRCDLQLPAGWIGRAVRAAAAPLGGHHLEGSPVADANGQRRLESALSLAKERGWSELVGWQFDPAAGVDDGLPERVDGRARKALGNGVVSACSKVIGKALIQSVGAP